MNRGKPLIALAVVTPLGLATKFYDGPGEAFVRSHLGGVLYVPFWVLAVLFVWPRLSPPRVAAGVLAVTSLLEVAQLWQPPLLQAVRSTFLGHALLGSTFSWLDFPCYLAGCLLALVLCRVCRA